MFFLGKMQEVDLQQRLDAYHSGEGRGRGYIIAETDLAARQEASLVSFLKGSLLAVPEFAQAWESLDPKSHGRLAFEESATRGLMQYSVVEIVGKEQYQALLPDWRRNFNRIIYNGRTPEDFHDQAEMVMDELGLMHQAGTEWFAAQVPPVANSASK